MIFVPLKQLVKCWVLYSSILEPMLNFQLNSLALHEQGVVDNRQINCHKVVQKITSMLVQMQVLVP